ncbi:RadC family protein [Caldifermentibacillus hisashii]|uniref:RadC family protein n=2 Tax=Caldifermentibacillus hisashii TaxID=996558 RepID=UPI0022B9455E|nr:DNA repair protein RadC [Caldifermentibacillus hisashii]
MLNDTGAFPVINIEGVFMKKYIQIAREEVATYSIVGNEEIVELQHLIAVIIGASANPNICGKLAGYGLKNLIDMSVYDLENQGLTTSEALRLHSALVLAKKLKNIKPEERKVIRSRDDAANLLMDEMRFLSQEHFVALFLNTKKQVIKKKTIFVGSLNEAIVHPREIFNEAIKHNSASIIVAHNHPSGDPTPSRPDIDVTRRLIECGNIIGIEVLDHIIIGDLKYTSMKEKGII